MRTLITLLLFITFSFLITACGGEKAESKKMSRLSFEKMFPDISDAKWALVNDTMWNASFTIDNKEVNVKFNSSGSWIKTSTNVQPDNLPSVVMDRIDGFYYGYVITRSFFVETPDLIAYEIDIDVNTKKIRLLIADNGALLKAQPAEQAESY